MSNANLVKIVQMMCKTVWKMQADDKFRGESFIWTGAELALILEVTNEYKPLKMMSKVTVA